MCTLNNKTITLKRVLSRAFNNEIIWKHWKKTTQNKIKWKGWKTLLI